MRTPAELPTPGGSYGRAYGVRWLTLPPTSLSHEGPHPRGAVGGGGRGADGGRGTGAVSETLARAPPWLFSAESDLSPVVWQPHVGEVGDPPRYDRTACHARLIDRNGRAHAMGTVDAHAQIWNSLTATGVPMPWARPMPTPVPICSRPATHSDARALTQAAPPAGRQVRVDARGWGAARPPWILSHFVCSAWPGSDGREQAMRAWGRWDAPSIGHALPEYASQWGKRRSRMVGLALPVVASTMEELTAWARLVVLSGALLGRTPVLPEARCMCMPAHARATRG